MSLPSDDPLLRIPSLPRQLQGAGIDASVLLDVIEFHINDAFAVLQNDFDQFEDPISYLQIVDYLDVLTRTREYLRPNRA